MKTLVICIGLLFFHYSRAECQVLIIKGKVKCMNQTFNSTKGAENIVIVPSFMPSKATVTLAEPSGYFELNTGLPLSKLQDKTVTIYALSRCTNCNEIAKRVFISEDQDRQNRNDTKQYVTIKDWMLKTSCTKAELFPFAADSALRIIVR